MWKFICISALLIMNCSWKQQNDGAKIKTGAEQTEKYIPFLKGKKVGLTVNHTSLIQTTHLIDTLIGSGVEVVTVFTPEHGFTGTASNGEEVIYDDTKSTYQLISLYGNNKKPTPDQIAGLDVMIFDIQDVGVRFYTYISTMHYVMEACAENNVSLIILDRPNPNGSYVDGPVLDTTLRSFVGMHPIPIVYGMTMGELALMINMEGWLKDGIKANLRIVKMQNWNHSTTYSLPVRPSPNLPNDLSISLYPSLCLFEGTMMSVGRGTPHAFQQIGHPLYPNTVYSFTPISRMGAKWPPYKDQVCYGRSWIDQPPAYMLTLKPLIDAYQAMDDEDFFNDYFKKLAGTNELQNQIENGMNEDEIRASWKKDLRKFKKIRSNYLLYTSIKK